MTLVPERIRLRNGRVIEAPLQRLVEFAEVDGTYQGYDQIVPDPLEMEALDIRLANRIIARMGADVSERILTRGGDVADALRRIPTDATLAAASDEVDWGSLRRGRLGQPPAPLRVPVGSARCGHPPDDQGPAPQASRPGADPRRGRPRLPLRGRAGGRTDATTATASSSRTTLTIPA